MEIHVSVDIRVRGEVLATERTGKHLPSVVQGCRLTDLVPIDGGIHNRKSGVSSREGGHLPAISRHVVPTERGATITGGPLDLGHPHQTVPVVLSQLPWDTGIGGSVVRETNGAVTHIPCGRCGGTVSVLII